MSLKHFNILEEDDDDPMLSSINLVDVFLVLVVALLAAVNLSSAGDPGAPVELAAHGEWSGQTMVVLAGPALRLSGYRVLAFYP